MSILEGPYAKLARAQSQFAELDTRLGIALKPEPDSIDAHFQPSRQLRDDGRVIWHFVISVGDMPTLPDGFGLSVGEALHNARGTLDHAVWQLVPRRKLKLTAAQRKQIAFPMATSRKNFWKGVKRQLPGLSNDLVTLIERYQPYRRSYEGRLMRYLRDLTNLDKHRTILVAFTYSGGADFDVNWEGCSKIGSQQLFKGGWKVVRGAKIGTLTLLCGAEDKPKVSVNGTIQYGVAFPPSVLRSSPDMSAVPVRYAMYGISNTCEKILGEIEARL